MLRNSQENAERPVAYFGEYEVLELVGRGGMASVVKARSPLGRGLPPIVALKFLHRALLSDADVLDAFRHEGVMGMKCSHPALCRTFAYEVVHGRPAIVLEYLQGSTLSQLYGPLADHKLSYESQRVIAKIVNRLSQALHAIHSCRDEFGESVKAVHRDVTPQNVVVTEEGEIKLLDLGVAFSLAREVKTASGLVKGKMSYLAPEYLLGRSWDRRIDVWACGVILWELLTGQRLFPGRTPIEKVTAVTSGRITAPSALRPGISAGLDYIVLRALQRDPERRYPDAKTMADELSEFSDHPQPAPQVRHWLRTLTASCQSGVMPTARKTTALSDEIPTVRPPGGRQGDV